MSDQQNIKFNGMGLGDLILYNSTGGGASVNIY